ncbi:tripartite motif-containing protein 16-like protein [Epinephelus fuscoguttatus]|uniref:tripartite motif-containing protein 16-like protein n=1 Tax=Epinephelus fuscoguttatus TaxID=293821 RepID=UPI0020D0E071|nr:tripartite motif-containing protein 16-like protein [Epinephelus fuscoguttatus]
MTGPHQDHDQLAWLGTGPIPIFSDFMSQLSAVSERLTPMSTTPICTAHAHLLETLQTSVRSPLARHLAIALYMRGRLSIQSFHRTSSSTTSSHLTLSTACSSSSRSPAPCATGNHLSSSAQRGVQLDRETFSCPICLDLLKDPVTTPCGHSYCMNCIKSFWDEEDEKKVHSCPQCRQTFTSRPVLLKNTMLAVLVEELKKEHKGHDTVSAAAERTERQRELEVSRQNIQQRIQDREKDVKLLQQEVEAINRSADKAVEDSEKIFTELMRLMEKRRRYLKYKVRSQQESEVSGVKELEEKLEQEITELKRKDAELMKLSHTEDHTQFLHNYSSLSPLSESTDSSSINIRPLRYFGDVTAAVLDIAEKLEDVMCEEWTNILQTVTDVGVLLSQPEPKTRAGFLKYSCDVIMDPNTAHTKLLLSEGNRKATVMGKKQSYSSHPDRFTENCQVLSRESLTGRCYWEVEWRGGGVGVAVTYKNISRAGDESVFGRNDKSWVLDCGKTCYHFWYNNIRTPVSGPQSSRVGVYLDHSAGILSFYSVSETMTLLHRVQTTFTQPLYAGLWLQPYDSVGDTAEFCTPSSFSADVTN